MSNDVQVVIALNGSDKETRNVVSTAINKYCKGKAVRISLVDVLEGIVRDPGIFNVPNSFLTLPNKDKALPVPVLIKDAHLRRIIGRVYNMLGDKYAFNPAKIGLNNFSQAVCKTPTELLRYVGMHVVRKVYPNFLPLVAYSRFLGRLGTFVIEDIKFHNELEVAQEKFQLVYLVEVLKDKKAKEVEDEYTGIREKFEEEEFFKQLKFNKNADELSKAVEALCKSIEEDVSKKIENGEIKTLVLPQGAVNSEEKRELKVGSMQVGKVVFEKGDPNKVKPWGDDEIIV